MKLTRSAAAFGAAAILAGAAAGCGSGSGSSSAAQPRYPAKLVVWRMGASVPSQVTWMNGVVTQFHKKFPQYKNTKVIVDWIPWSNRVTDWTNALTSGKGGPDITELGNTDTPGIATQGGLADVTSDVKAWSYGSGMIAGNLANDTVNGQNYAVPWFGGVRGVWYRKDEFAKAGITSAPATWAQLVSDAKLLQKKYPGTYGLGAPSDYTNAIVSFIWGAGGQVAIESGGKWIGRADHAAGRGGHQVLRRPVPDPARLPVEVHRRDRTGRARRHLGRLQRGLRPGQAGHVHRRPVGAVRADRGEQEVRVGLGLVPDPERERAEPGPGLRRRLRPRRLGQEQVQARPPGT